MKCIERTLDGAVLVSAEGRIDLATADAFRDALLGAQARSSGAIIVDLSAVDYISSAGLRSLMIVFKASKSAGKLFAVARPSPLLREIFTISRMHLVFPIFEDLRAAVGQVAPAALAGFDAT
jgi:anti-anti-sigma factor